ncbi:MAG TPA: XDD4 family exosortase-dependent surface protein [Clostridia bacterium]|nr:XDD4 family exosortase-dependent surface protein [Clostridia bacterium]
MSTNIGRRTLAFVAAGIVAGAASSATAALVFTGSSGAKSASVKFEQSGSQLFVTLANTSTADATVPTDILTAVFFNFKVNPNLSPVSAVLGGGGTVFYSASQPAGGVVGGEWGYGAGLSGAPKGDAYGISSSGLNIFGQPTFPGGNLAGPAALDGLQYGITTAADNPATGNGGITGNALIKNSVVFTFNIQNPSFALELGSVKDVVFQYGTSLTEPSFDGFAPVPEPGTALAGAMVLLPFALSTLRSVRKIGKR